MLTHVQCFLTMPAIIFLTMTPRFPRTRKLANPYAMATVDGLFSVFWLSAFASQAAYNTAGECGKGCNVSKAVVAFGVIIWYVYSPRYAVWIHGHQFLEEHCSSLPPNNIKLLLHENPIVLSCKTEKLDLVILWSPIRITTRTAKRQPNILSILTPG